jgi:hypothetical protein
MQISRRQSPCIPLYIDNCEFYINICLVLDCVLTRCEHQAWPGDLNTSVVRTSINPVTCRIHLPTLLSDAFGEGGGYAEVDTSN